MSSKTFSRNNKTKNAFKRIHLYLSIPFGVVIALICFSGAMLGLEKDIAPLFQKHLLYATEIKSNRIPLDTLVQRTQASLPDDVRITDVNVFPDSTRNYQFSLSKPRKSSLYVNPYTSEVMGKNERLPFFQSMFRLHRWFFGPAKAADGGIGWGKLLVGVSTLLFIGILLTGVGAWWPKTKQALRASLKIPFRRGTRPLMHGIHLAGGLYTLLLLLVMALTGLTWSFSWYRDSLNKLLGAGSPTTQAAPKEKPTIKGERKGGGKEKEADFAWEKALANVKSACPNFEQITISKQKASVKTGNFGNSRAADQYSFNNRGEIVKFTDYSETEYEKKLRGWYYTLHTGSFAGAASRWLWMIAAFVGSLLPITGYYLWWKRKFRK